jgi:hypothetical protein
MPVSSHRKKRYYVVFTVDITVPEITKENARQLVKNAMRGCYQEVLARPDTWKVVAANERLVQALLRPEHAEVFDALL